MVRCTAVDEAVLDAIRRALPAPTVHARNLFHLSAAMWDAWAAYDPDAAGYFVERSTRPTTSPPRGTRRSAMRRTGCSITGTGPRSAARTRCSSSSG